MTKNEEKYQPLERTIKEEPYEPSPEEIEEMFKAEEEGEEGEEENFGSNIEEDYKDNSILMHCKPVYNFQSIEFDIVVDKSDPESMEEMKGLYSAVLNILQSVAVDQPAQVKPRPLPAPEDRPTEKMIKVMQDNGIKYDQYTTKKQAQALIQKSMEESR